MNSVPDDPFFGKIINTSDRLVLALAGTYFYGDNEAMFPGADNNFGGLQVGVAEQLGLQPLKEGQWALLGLGPDMTAEELGGTERLRGVPYDPTNGLISKGDITVRGGG
jgi:hypothetical protein